MLAGTKADVQQVANAEAKLGFSLPPLLKNIYTEVANGATRFFGGRLIGVEGGIGIYDANIVDLYFSEKDATEDEDDEMVTFVYQFQGRRFDVWPESLLRFCCWPGDLYACVYCNSASFPVHLFDASSLNPYEPLTPIPIPMYKESFEEWIEYGLSHEDTIWEEMRGKVRTEISRINALR
jgi:hypothetical protein